MLKYYEIGRKEGRIKNINCKHKTQRSTNFIRLKTKTNKALSMSQNAFRFLNENLFRSSIWIVARYWIIKKWSILIRIRWELYLPRYEYWVRNYRDMKLLSRLYSTYVRRESKRKAFCIDRLAHLDYKYWAITSEIPLKYYKYLFFCLLSPKFRYANLKLALFRKSMSYFT